MNAEEKSRQAAAAAATTLRRQNPRLKPNTFIQRFAENNNNSHNNLGMVWKNPKICVSIFPTAAAAF